MTNGAPFLATVYVAEMTSLTAYTVDVFARATTGDVLAGVMRQHLQRPVTVDQLHSVFVFGWHVPVALTHDVEDDTIVTDSRFGSLDLHPGELLMDRSRRFSPYLVISR